MTDKEYDEYWKERSVFPEVIPDDVKFLIKNIAEVDEELFQKLLNLSVRYLRGRRNAEECGDDFDQICDTVGKTSAEESYKIGLLYAGMISLVKAVLKVNLKATRQDTFMADLSQIGLPINYAKYLSEILYGKTHADIMKDIISSTEQLCHVEDCKGFVNIEFEKGISKAKNVSFKIKLSDGNMHEFTSSIDAFHQLRQLTASTLHQMQRMHKRNKI